MTTTDSIWAAAEHLLRRDAEELRESSTSSQDRDDWTGEEEAKAAYDEHIAAADALASLSTAEPVRPLYGWVLVPAKPTREWIGAVADDGYADCDVAQLIASILSHAPAAPAAVAGPVKLPFAIMDDELEALRRFDECARDFEAGGHDVRKKMMKRLAEIGLVRRVTANIYEHTTFGLSVLGGDFDAAPTTQAAPAAQMGALTPADADQLEKVINDFNECGETDVPYTALQRYAAMGYLECTHYHAMPAARAAIDAARAAKEGSAREQNT